MRGYDRRLEERFFHIFQDYYDLERNTARRYAHGEYTLARMNPIAEAAGNPEATLPVIHVAGTKGKGSTCHLISALLSHAGYKCGMFTSPHLATVRERFQIDNQLVPYEMLNAVAEPFEASLREKGLKPSLFEAMTVMGLSLFAQEQCDFAVMETGIGGRLDATNYVPAPRCCAITPVSFDHTQLLGNTIEEIAAEKAGIVKPGIPVVCASQPYTAARDVIVKRARELAAPLVQPATQEEVHPFLEHPTPPFLRENLATALAVCNTIGVTPQPYDFQMPEFRARCECISRKPMVILDGAHNADSARRLVEAIETLYPRQHFTVVLGIVKGKDVKGILRELRKLTDSFVLTNPEPPKESALEELTRAAGQLNLNATIVPSIQDRSQLPPDTPLLFTGSFFTALIGERLFHPGP